MNSSRQDEHPETWSMILFFLRTDADGSNERAMASGEGHPFRVKGFLETAYPRKSSFSVSSSILILSVHVLQRFP